MVVQLLPINRGTLPVLSALNTVLVPLGLDAGWGSWGMFSNVPYDDIYARLIVERKGKKQIIKLVGEKSRMLPSFLQEQSTQVLLGHPNGDIYQQRLIAYYCLTIQGPKPLFLTFEKLSMPISEKALRYRRPPYDQPNISIRSYQKIFRYDCVRRKVV